MEKALPCSVCEENDSNPSVGEASPWQSRCLQDGFTEALTGPWGEQGKSVPRRDARVLCCISEGGISRLLDAEIADLNEILTS